MKLSQPEQTKLSDLTNINLSFQPKLNGIRARWDGTNLLTRNNRIITCVPHIVESLRPFSHYPFDGELYFHGSDFQVLNGLIRRKKHIKDHLQIQFHVFDLIDDNNQQARIEILKSLPTIENIRFVETITGVPAETLYDLFIANGYEGLIARDLTAKYAENVYKIKPVFDSEYKVIKLHENGFICVTPDNQEFKINAKNHGLKVGELATIEYSAKTQAGIPFHGRFKAVRFDLSEELHGNNDTGPESESDNSSIDALCSMFGVTLKVLTFVVVFFFSLFGLLTN